MKKGSAEVDRYIETAAPFAQPILEKIRTAFHKADPRIEETLKWSVPHFEYKGILAGMAAFKQHVRWGFWKASLMDDPAGILQGEGSSPAGLHVATAKELPPENVLIAYVREAVRLNEEGVKADRKTAGPAQAFAMPPALAAALKKNAAARATFAKLSQSHKNEYIEWIAEAKQEATRAKRVATAMEWLAEGKPRNWKYMKRG